MVREITLKVYKFNELKPEIQNKVIEKFRENNDYPFLSEDLKAELENILDENKITIYNDSLKLYYSLNYSQGDGVMFEGVFEWKNYTIKIKHSGHYYHYRSIDIDIWAENKDGDEIELYSNENDFKEFLELYKDICDQVEKIGYSDIEYQNSDESIKETIDANDYEFYDTGEIV